MRAASRELRRSHSQAMVSANATRRIPAWCLKSDAAATSAPTSAASHDLRDRSARTNHHSAAAAGRFIMVSAFTAGMPPQAASAYSHAAARPASSFRVHSFAARPASSAVAKIHASATSCMTHWRYPASAAGR
jgi:hypothetical protein